jgi:hypothetical protein
VTVIPINGDSIPSRSDDRAKVRCSNAPANAVADFKESGLIARHLRFTLTGSTSRTRSIALWPEKLLRPSSHLMVTYLASIDVTLPLSAGSSLKQTRVPTFSCLDCSGVIS